MGLLQKILKHDMVYWAPSDPPNNDMGKAQFEAPRALKVRWEDAQKTFVSLEGETRTSQAIIFSGEDLAVGGVVFRGTLAQVEFHDRPFDNKGTWKIQNFSKVDNVSGSKVVRKAFV